MAQNDELLFPWSTGLWQDLGMPTNVSVSTISGYAIQPSTLGKVNSLLSTYFSGSGYTGAGTTNYQIGPWVDPAVLGVIGQLYLVSYYNNLAMAAMGQGGNTLPWQLLREGDSTIGRVSAANIGKEYREMSKTAYEQLWNLVNAYRSDAGGGTARSISYYNPPLGYNSYSNGGEGA